MALWKVKGCPRCGGDVFIDSDMYGWYLKCLQCGYCGEFKGMDESGNDPAREDKMPVGTPGHEPWRR